MPPSTINQSINFSANQQSLNNMLNQINAMFGRNPISVSLSARRFTQPLGRITGSVTEFDKSLEAANARVVAFGASAGALYSFQRALKSVLNSVVDVEKALTDINIIANLSDRSLSKFSNELFNIARDTAQGFQTVAEAATEFSRQGLTVEETLKRTKDALILVRQSGLSAEDSVSSLTAILNSFNDTALDSTKIVNKLASVDAAFAVSSKDLVEGFKRVGSSAKDSKVGFEQLIAVIAATQERTARGGAVIGNSLKTIFTRLQRTSVLDQLEDLGVAVRDLNTGESLSAIAILQNLANAFDGLSEAKRSKVSESVAGVFQINTLKGLLGDLKSAQSNYKQALGIANEETNQAIERNIKLNETLDALFKRATANITELSAKYGSLVFEDFFKDFGGGFNKIAESLLGDSESTGQDIAKGIFKGIGSFISGPGLAILGLVVGKLGLQFAVFTADIIKKFASINNYQKQSLNLQEAISAQLARNPSLMDAYSRGIINSTQLQKSLLTLLEREAVLRQQMQSTIVGQASGIYNLGGRASNSGQVTRLPNSGGSGYLRFPSFAKNVPNFAGKSDKSSNIQDGVDDAIERERKAGIPKNKIRIGFDKKLISRENPLGLGIYNTIDEPLGLRQGINRELSAGRNPQKSGFVSIPSFADNENRPINPFPSNPSRIANPTLAYKFEDVVKNQEEQKKIALEDQRRAAEFNKNIKDVAKNTAPIKHGGILDPVHPNTIAREERYLFNRGTKDFVSAANTISGTSLPRPSILNGQSDDIRNFENNVKKPNQQQTTISGDSLRRDYERINRDEANANLARTKQERAAQAAARRSAAFQSFGQKAMIGAFLAPMIGGIISEQIGDETLTQRRSQGVVGGLSNTAAFAGTGALIGGPWGAAAGAAVGAITSIMGVTKEWSNTLPDLEKRLQKAKEETQRRSDIVKEFLEIADKIQNPNLSDQEKAELVNKQASLFSGSLLSKPFSDKQSLELVKTFSEKGEKAFVDLFKNIEAANERGTKQIEATTALKGLINQTRGFFGKSLKSGNELNELGKSFAQVIANSSTTIKSSSGKSLVDSFNDENIDSADFLKTRLQGNILDLLEQRVQKKTRYNPSIRSDETINQVEYSNELKRLSDVQKSVINSITSAYKDLGAEEFAIEIKKVLSDLDPDTFKLVIKEFKDGILGSTKTGNQNELAKILSGSYKKMADDLNNATFHLENFKKKVKETSDSIDLSNVYRGFVSESESQSLRNSNDIFAAREQNKIDALKTPTNEFEILAKQFKLDQELERRKLNESIVSSILKLKEDSSGFGTQTIRKIESDASSLGVEEALQSVEDFRSSINSFIENSDKSNFNFSEFNKMISGLIGKARSQGGLVDRKLIDSLVSELESVQTSSMKAEFSTQTSQIDLIHSLEKLTLANEKNTRTIEEDIKSRQTFNIEEFRRNQKDSLLKLKSEEAFRTGEFGAGVGGSDEMRNLRSEIRALERRTGNGTTGLEELKGAGTAFRDEFAYNRVDFFDQIDESARETARTIKSESKSAFKAFVDGSLEAGDAFRQFGLGVLERIQDMVTDMAFNNFFNAIGGAFGKFGSNFGSSFSGYSNGGRVSRYSSGGEVVGGSGTKDDVPALLQGGEYVIKKKAVEKIGRGNLAALNSGQNIEKILSNRYVYNDEKRPTKGEFQVSEHLSAFAQTEEINRQNQIKFERESTLISYLKELEAYNKNKKETMDAFKKSQRNRQIGNMISAVIGIGGAAAGQYFGGSGGGGGGGTGGTDGSSGISAQSGYSDYGVSYNQAPITSGYGSGSYYSNYGVGYAKGGQVLKSGMVNGQSSPKDTIPALLTGGEYVIKKSIVDRYGIPFFNKLNNGSSSTLQKQGFQKRATGGLVGQGSAYSMGQEFVGEGNSISIDENSIRMLSSAIVGSLSNSDASKAAKSNENSNINYNVKVDIQDSGAGRNGSEENGNNSSTENEKERDRKEFAKTLEALVISLIIREKRPGGLLYG